MAIYPYKCVECGREEEIVQSISSYCDAPVRPVCCQGQMARVLTPVLTAVDRQSPYVSPIDGSVIDSREKERQHMSKHGVVHFDEIKPDIERNRKARLEAAVADVKNDIVEAVHMVEAGKAAKPIPESELIPTE